MAASPPLILFISLLLLSTTQSHSLFFSNYRILVSLSHSLASRVATLRAARGDVDGAARARNLARNIERGMGLGFYKLVLNMGWDFLKNLAWSDTMSFGTLAAVLPDLKELLAAVGDFNRINSDAGRVAWIGRNYGNVLRVSKSLFTRLLKVFGQSVCLSGLLVPFLVPISLFFECLSNYLGLLFCLPCNCILDFENEICCGRALRKCVPYISCHVYSYAKILSKLLYGL